MNYCRPHFLPAVVLLLTGCAFHPAQRPTLATLPATHAAAPPATRASVVGLQDTIRDYQTLADTAPRGPIQRQALRRLADLHLETAEALKYDGKDAAGARDELRASIDLYRRYLSDYPGAADEEEALYQLAEAYDLNGMLEDSAAALARLLHGYPDGKYADEAWFRSGEIDFSLSDYPAAATAYHAVVEHFSGSRFYEHALYKYAWSLYLQDLDDQSLAAFFDLLDREYAAGDLTDNGFPEHLSPAKREMIEDSLRAVNPALSRLGADDPLAKYFPLRGPRRYEPLVRRRLGEWYLAKERYGDAAAVFLGLAHRRPEHPLAPVFHQYAIQAYEAGKFAALALDATTRFVELYGVDGAYWRSQDETVRNDIRPLLAGYIRKLAAYYHAAARRNPAGSPFDAAVKWYALYIHSFPDAADAPRMHFLLAEALYEGGRYDRAIEAYEQTAYAYPPHADAAEAGYKALLTYWEQTARQAPAQRDAWRRKAVASALRFGERFPRDPRADGALAKAAEELYAMGDYPAAIDAAQRLLAHTGNVSDPARRVAWAIQGHAAFATGDFADAETSYREWLAVSDRHDPKRPEVIDNLAASIYKQGEASRAAGDLPQAARHFLRIREAAPASAIRVTAQYDAAAVYIALREWPAAAAALEELRNRRLGDARLQNEVTEKLAVVYAALGDKPKAAREMEAVAELPGNGERRRDALWQAAGLYADLGRAADAIRIDERYVREFPLPFAEAMEVRARLRDLYQGLGKADKADEWRRNIIAADRAAGDQRTERSRRLAAEATLDLTVPLLEAYRQARLTVPLDKSLKRKKRAMEAAISAYKRALEYRVADVSTAATFHLGELYGDFARALITSDPPPGLSKLELEQYQLLLEEQASQFEDKAVEIYGNYTQYIKQGIYDQWVKNSVAALAKLYPARYAKTEARERYVDLAE